MVFVRFGRLSIRTYGSPWHFFVHQANVGRLGRSGLRIALRVDYHVWRRLMAPALAVSVAGLVAVLVPGVGVKVSGASRWLGSSSLQAAAGRSLPKSPWCCLWPTSSTAGATTGAGLTGDTGAAGAVLAGGFGHAAAGHGDVDGVGAIALGMLFAAGLPFKGLAGLVSVGAAGAFGAGRRCSLPLGPAHRLPPSRAERQQRRLPILPSLRYRWARATCSVPA